MMKLDEMPNDWPKQDLQRVLASEVSLNKVLRHLIDDCGFKITPDPITMSHAERQLVFEKILELFRKDGAH